MNQLIRSVDEKYGEYLSDESKLTGNANTISFPKTEAEVVQIVKTIRDTGQTITVQGAKTGIAGAAVPNGGHILNITEMNKVTSLAEQEGHFSLSVEPGYTLMELHSGLAKRNFVIEHLDEDAKNILAKIKKTGQLMWAPDPTETSATVGGVAASDARGICSRLYGSAREHIKRIRVVTTDAEIWEIERGCYQFDQGKVLLPNGKLLVADPTAIGFTEEADLIDMFLGSEGMFGVITNLTLDLQPQPNEIWGICFFFDTETEAISFLESVDKNGDEISERIAALEYLDKGSLQFIQEFKRNAAKLQGLPDISEQYKAMVYLEVHAAEAEQAEEAAEWLMEKADEFGSDIDGSWAVSGDVEMEKVRALRHAVPESINIRIEQLRKCNSNILKLGTDMELPNASLSSLIEMYRQDLHRLGLNGVIFGHVTNGHFHVNVLPENEIQYSQGKQLILKWGKQVAGKGGRTTVEHGVGKLKKELFLATAAPESIKTWKLLKSQLDPVGLWNPGNRLE